MINIISKKSKGTIRKSELIYGNKNTANMRLSKQELSDHLPV